MSSEIIKRDENHVTVLAGVTNDANQEVRMLRVDPTTGRLLIDFDILTVDSIKARTSSGMVFESANGTDIGLLGAGNTANVTWYGSHNFDTATQDTIAAFTGSGKTLGSLATATYPTLTQLAALKNAPYVYYRNHTAAPNTGGGTVTITPTAITAGLIDGTNKSCVTVSFVYGFGAAAETKTVNCTLYDGTNTLSPASTGFTTTATSQSGRCSFEFYRNSASTATANGFTAIGQGIGTGSLNRYAGNAGTPGTFDWTQALTITITANSTTGGNIALNNVIVTLS